MRWLAVHDGYADFGFLPFMAFGKVSCFAGEMRYRVGHLFGAGLVFDL